MGALSGEVRGSASPVTSTGDVQHEAEAGWKRPDRFQQAFVASLAGSTLLTLVAGWDGKWALPVAAALIFGIYVVLARALGYRTAAIALMVLLSAQDALEFSAGKIFIRGEQLAALIAVVAVLATRSTKTRWWRLSPLELTLVGWFLVNVASSFLAAPDLRTSLKIIAIIIISSAGLFIPPRLGLSTSDIDRLIHLQLLVFAAVAAYGLLALIAHPIFHSTFGLTFNRVTHELVASGPLWEPNVFGDYCAAGSIAWLLIGPRYFGRPWSTAGLALCLSGTAVSLTRAAWLGLAIVIVIVGLTRIRRQLDVRATVAAAGALLLAAAWFSVAYAAGEFATSNGPNRPELVLAYTGAPTVSQTPPASTPASPPPTPASTPSSPSPTPASTPASQSPTPKQVHGVTAFLTNPTDIVGRLLQFQSVMYDWRSHPILGAGTASWGQRYHAAGMNLWIASLPLRIIYDTGIVGVVFFGAFAALVAAAALGVRQTPIGAMLGLILLDLLVTNLSTETLELMFGWLFVGVMVAWKQSSEQATPMIPPT